MRWLVVAVTALVVTGCGGSDGAPKRAAQTPTPTPTPAPPILPDKRVVAFYGNPAADELGILGIGSPALAGRRLLRQAKAYERSRRPVQPAMELLAVIANAHPGDDGLYRRREGNAVIRRYLKAARKVKAILILDIQPGRADFFEETVALKRWLKEPDVHLALDPEWRMKAGQVPGQVIGQVDAREVNAVSAWLEQLIVGRNLPPKLLIIHQFTNDMIQGRDRLKPRERVQIVLNADGFGGRAIKKAKYREFTRGKSAFHEGFKLFYKEDLNLMRPRQVIRLRPSPDFVVYE
jgi:hypothetical protein